MDGKTRKCNVALLKVIEVVRELNKALDRLSEEINSSV